MPTPRWDDDPATYAREEAGVSLARGLAVPPVLVLFEGNEPTLYLRVRPDRADRAPTAALWEASAFAARFGAARALAVYGAVMSDPAIEDPDVRQATGSPAVIAEWAARDTTTITHDGVLLSYAIGDDGTVAWRDRDALEGGGGLRELLAMIVARDRGPLAAMPPDGLAYALSRGGTVVGVARSWRARYGFDRMPDPRKVRPVDRERARRARTAREVAN